MRANVIRKLLLVPVLLTTGCLVVAFVAPAAAAGAVRTVAPALHVPSTIVSDAGAALSTALGTVTVPIARPGAQQVPATAGNLNAVSRDNSQAGSDGLPAISSDGVGHSIATVGQQNCGRYGNGFHGGKHNFVCPNRPFPGVKSHF